MAGVPSVNALFQVAKQASKGTAPTTGFITGLMEQSGMSPRFDPLAQSAEHGIAVARVTDHRSPTKYGSYAVGGPFRMNFYPHLIGRLLQGAGFETAGAGAGAGAAKTHTFTLSERADHHWLTMLSQIGDEKKRATDCRINALSFAASPDELKVNGTYVGLTYDDAAGTETTTAENTTKLVPSVGSLVLTVNSVAIVDTATDTLSRFTMDIANPLDEADRSVFRFKRVDLPQVGLGITGSIEGLDLTYTNYDELIRAGASSGEPSSDVATGSLVWKVESAGDIPTDTVPFSFEVTLASVEVTLDDFVADGSNMVRWNTKYRMIDNVTTPISIALVNTMATYV